MTASTAVTAAPWWRRPWLLALLIILASAPVWVTTLPPLIDYFGHMGRYRIQLGIDTSPFLQENWDFQWALIANLGVDLLIIPLSALLGLESAIWLIGAILAPLVAWGMLRAASAVHGVVTPGALAALPFALAYPFQYGFVNYWLGLGIAFHLFASWASGAQDRQSAVRTTGFALASVALWITHVFSWGIMGILVGSFEFARAIAARQSVAAALWQVIQRCWSLALPFALMFVWRSNGEGATTEGWFRWEYKIASVTSVLRDQNMALDIASLIAVAMLLWFALRDRRLGFDPRLGYAALIFFAIAVVFPFQLFGSAYADARTWPVAFATALLAIRFDRASAALRSAIAAASIALFATRIAIGTAGFAQYEADMSRHLRAIEYIEPGARVVSLVARPCQQSWRRPRLDHLGSTAILRRDAFVNSQWDVPGAQLLRPLGGKETRFNADPSQFVIARSCTPDLRPRLAERIALIPKDRFDYVWVFDFDPAGLPAYPGLTSLYADDRTILYKIEGLTAK